MTQFEMRQAFKLTFEIHELPKMPNQLLGSHWAIRSKHAKKWKLLVQRELIKDDLIFNPPRLKNAKLTLTRFAAGRGPDYDNLALSFKPVIDALVSSKVIIDDTMAVIGKSDYRFEKGKRNEGKIKVEIEEIVPSGVAG